MIYWCLTKINHYVLLLLIYLSDKVWISNVILWELRSLLCVSCYPHWVLYKQKCVSIKIHWIFMRESINYIFYYWSNIVIINTVIISPMTGYGCRVTAHWSTWSFVFNFPSRLSKIFRLRFQILTSCDFCVHVFSLLYSRYFIFIILDISR